MRYLKAPVCFSLLWMLVLSPLCAAAGQDGKGSSGVGDEFAAADANKDNMISRDEWKGSTEEFNRRDADNSGSLSRYEFYQNLWPGNL